VDLDDDNDGIPDAKEGPSGTDTDGDGIPDTLDLDSDNDGILDAVESGAPAQTLDGDGRIVGAVGSNGLIDALESDDTATAMVTYNGGDPVNTDGTDSPDFRDPDSDNDGVNDVIEAGGPTADPDGDGLIGSGTPAVNGFGVAAGAGLTPPDTDGDGNPDFRDLVGDTNSDHDGDGIPDPFDLDDDNDGIPDSKEGPTGTDTDGDGIIDALDLDSDNDGIHDAVESGASGVTVTAGRIAGAVGTNGLPDAVESSVESGITNYNNGEPVNTDGDTVLQNIPGSSAYIYGPNTSPNSGSPQLAIGDPIDQGLYITVSANEIDGQTLKAPNDLSSRMTDGATAVYTGGQGIITDPSGGADFTAYIKVGDSVVFKNVFVDGVADLNAIYTVTDISTVSITVDPSPKLSQWVNVGGTPQPLAILSNTRTYHDLGYVWYHTEGLGRDEQRNLGVRHGKQPRRRDRAVGGSRGSPKHFGRYQGRHS